MNFKWIRFLIKWIINELDWSKSGLDKKIRFFVHPTFNDLPLVTILWFLYV